MLEILSSSSAFSQVVPDATLPNPSQVRLDNNIHTIEGGTTAGNNLFHSFEDFSVPTGSEAFFNNATTVENILTRVTGSNISNLDGLIRANGTANLFLLNPNGIVFGENAQLDLGGSFFATTSESLVFANGLEFSATSPEAQPLLSVNVPVGLQLGANPAPVEVRSSTLEVSPDRTLALIGGSLNLEGASLTAPGGRVEFGGLSNAGTVELNRNNVLRFPSDLPRADVALSRATQVDVTSGSGGAIAINSRDLSLSQGSQLRGGLGEELGIVEAIAGDITINATGNTSLTGTSSITSEVTADASGNGGNIELTTGSLSFTDGSRLETVTRGGGDGGRVVVRASGAIVASGVNAADPEIPSGITTTSLGAGNGGNVEIVARDLTLSEGGQIRSLNRESGFGGDLLVEVSESVVATGINALDPSLASGIVSFTSGTAEGGQVNLSTGRLTLSEGGDVGSFVRLVGEFFPGAGTGNGGDVTIEARESIEIIGFNLGSGNGSSISSWTLGGGDGGYLSVSTPRLRITEGGQLTSGVLTTTASAGEPLPERGTGNGGNVTVNASESIEVLGNTSSLGPFTFGSGDAGRLSIATSRLEIRDGGIVSGATWSSGNAGSITIEANFISISGVVPETGQPARISASAVRSSPLQQRLFSVPPVATGDTSELTIDTDRLSVTDGGLVSVQHEGTGNAGQLQINAGSVQLDNGGAIAASATSGQGGNIIFDVPESLVLRQGSEISAEAGGLGDGGNLTINANTLVVLENSQILANAFEGSGGNVRITTEGIFLSPESEITASSQLGVDGIVEITNPEIDTNAAFVQLSSNPIDPATQVVSACDVAAENTFVVTGNGGLPPDPTEVLHDRTVWEDIRLTEIRDSPVESENEERSPATELDSSQLPLVEATGWQWRNDGTIELVAAPQYRARHRWLEPVRCSDR
ncbi:two-partner secretion domain-containing protein [Baaleninema simplex]|uniref:two-partner secretion domain-containing protein n=1 Tax=Baaleninema simplex TaxID=2862350 RepID=UPI000370B3DD|nr:S-layer family protein [Baaleninema simplex]